jgi:hypothetical protein
MVDREVEGLVEVVMLRIMRGGTSIVFDRDDCVRLVREAGIEVDCAFLAEKIDTERLIPVLVVTILGALTFDMLAKASELLGTRRIDISCDLGCESDCSHSTDITFWNPSPSTLAGSAVCVKEHPYWKASS